MDNQQTLYLYIRKILNMRTARVRSLPTPHKFILLLAVIYEIESGNICENKIMPNLSLQETFLSFWNEYVHIKGFRPNFAMPFHHLMTDGFWHLTTVRGNVRPIKDMRYTFTLKTLRGTVKYASLDAELFGLFLIPDIRAILREAIISELFKNGFISTKAPCPFCNPSASVIAENSLAIAFYDKFPVSEGHMLIVPKRHVSSFFDLQQDELKDIHTLELICRDIISQTYCPDGFNIGVNINLAAGQSVFHCHVHLIPRYFGDVVFPRGGVRGVVPSKQEY